MRRVLIWGGGGHGKVVADLVRSLGWNVVGFADRDESLLGEVVEPLGASVICREREIWGCLGANHADTVALAIGDNECRWRAYLTLAGNIPMPPLVHPSAYVHPTALLDEGAVIMPRAIIGPHVRVGRAAIVNTSAELDEHVSIEEAVHVSPGAIIMERSRIRARAWVCSGAIVEPEVVVGEDTVVGAGAVAPRDIPPGRVVMGIPAI